MGYREEFLKLTLLNDISCLHIARTCAYLDPAKEMLKERDPNLDV